MFNKICRKGIILEIFSKLNVICQNLVNIQKTENLDNIFVFLKNQVKIIYLNLMYLKPDSQPKNLNKIQFLTKKIQDTFK